MPASKMKKKNDFQRAVGRLVNMNLAFHSLNKTAEEELGLSLVQYHLLHTLRDMPGSAPQRLAQVVGMHPSTLTQSMKRLLKKKMIFAEEDPRDSRKKIIGLTHAGEIALKNFENGLDRFSPLKENHSLLRSKFDSMGPSTELDAET